jgi:peptidoglycan/xylan/chitin deacetylase (PgdA/CDA1 family)
MKALSLTFHDVTDGSNGELVGVKALYKLYPRDFHNHILSIRKRNTEISVSSIRCLGTWDTRVPVFLTFDDGELGAYTCVAGELEQYGWRGHFFITTNWIGLPGFLGRAQIRELHRRGHVIGSHSCSHPERMSQLTWAELIKEWSESRSTLSDLLGEETKVASVPNGFYSRKVGKAAAAAGYEVLFTSEPTSAARILHGCLILGRYAIQIHMPPAVSGAIAAGNVCPRWRQSVAWEAKKVVKALTGDSYFAIRRYMISRHLLQNAALKSHQQSDTYLEGNPSNQPLPPK